MKLKNRTIPVTKLPGSSLIFLKLLPRLFIVKRPFVMLKHYIRQDSPDFIELRSGLRISLSSHPHDIITFFVVFLKKDYGNVKKGSVVIDVGANIGIFSLFAALSGAKKVYAFEPSREAFLALIHNIEANQLTDIIIPVNKVVGDCDNVTVKFPVSSSPYNKVRKGDATDYENCYDVQTVTLNSFIEDNNISHIDLLKLDCEGCEFDVLLSENQGGLEKTSEIRMECHGRPDELIEWLSHKGYVVNKIKSDIVWLTRRSD